MCLLFLILLDTRRNTYIYMYSACVTRSSIVAYIVYLYLVYNIDVEDSNTRTEKGIRPQSEYGVCSSPITAHF